MTDDEFERKYKDLMASGRVQELLSTERDKSNTLYAVKLVERIVFGAVGLALVTLFGAVITLVVRGPT